MASAAGASPFAQATALYAAGGKGRAPKQNSGARSKARPREPRVPRVWTAAEQKELLKNYIEIPREYWPLVAEQSMVRYRTLPDGEFKYGGRVVNGSHEKVTELPDGGDHIVRSLQLSPMYGGSHFQRWCVGWDAIKSLYVQRGALEYALQAMVEKSVNALNDNIKQLAKYVQKLEKRIIDLEKR